MPDFLFPLSSFFLPSFPLTLSLALFFSSYFILIISSNFLGVYTSIGEAYLVSTNMLTLLFSMPPVQQIMLTFTRAQIIRKKYVIVIIGVIAVINTAVDEFTLKKLHCY